MQVIDLTGQPTETIKNYASSARVAAGRGDTRVHVVVFDPGTVPTRDVSLYRYQVT